MSTFNDFTQTYPPLLHHFRPDDSTHSPLSFRVPAHLHALQNPPLKAASFGWVSASDKWPAPLA